MVGVPQRLPLEPTVYPARKNKDCSNSLGSCIFHEMVVQVQANLSAELFELEHL